VLSQRIVYVGRRLKYAVQRLICQAVLRADYNSEWALFHLGNAYAEHGDLARAIPLWQRACAQAAPRAVALQNLATTLLQLDRSEEAIAVLQRLAALKPDLYLVHTLLGRAYQQVGQLHSAITAYDRAVALHPEDDRLRVVLGRLFERTHQYTQAIACYHQIKDAACRKQIAARLTIIEQRYKERV
jgi:tetratricopeptide (TPR) repeat protein